MDEYLIDLLERISTKCTDCDSSKSITWKAYREAEALNDAKYVPQLIDYISTEKNKINRDSAYFILGKMLTKVTNNTAIQFYIDRLTIETDKYVLGSMLGRLAEIHKDDSIDISPIIQCTKSDK